MNLEGRELVANPELRPVDRWIYSRLAGAARTSIDAYEGYRYNEAATAAYEFFWNDFCDWYVEATKLSTKSGDAAEKDRAVTVLLDVLSECLKLLHPLLPFVTEEIYSKLPSKKSSTKSLKYAKEECADDFEAGAMLITAAFPSGDEGRIDRALEADFAFVQEIGKGVRTLRAECAVPPEKRLRVEAHIAEEKLSFIEKHSDLISLLAGLQSLTLCASNTADQNPRSPLPVPRSLPTPQGSIGVAGDGFETFVFIAEAVDITALVAKWKKEIEKDRKFAAGLRGKLANENFLSRAPEEVVKEEKEKLALAESRIGKTESYIGAVG
jgi:valyl-tRNA synthetase